MDNQHQKIKGYRDLSEDEIELMNEVKEKEVEVLDLVRRIQQVHKNQMAFYNQEANLEEQQRHNNAEPERWAAMARTDFQVGFMKLVRSVAQPKTN